MKFPFKSKIYKFINANIRNIVYKEIISPLALGLAINEQREKQNIRNKKVLYTCLTGKYDCLQIQQFVDVTVDYVCFTDNSDLLKYSRLGMWEIRPLKYNLMDNTKNSRWHKTHPHVLFPEYEQSVWVDSNILIKSSFITDLFSRTDLILIPAHNTRDCIYDEAKACVKMKKENKANAESLIAYYVNEKFPRHYGLNETNVIYRKHNDENLKAIMEEWWTFVETKSKRDQLSLSYILWKHDIKPKNISIPNLRDKYNDVIFVEHSGGGTSVE